MNRVAVPESPVLISFGPGGMRAAQPSMCIVRFASSIAVSMPSARRASAQTRVSSERPTSSMWLVPSASAATMSARLVMLRDPGGRMEPHTGPGATAI